MSELVIEESPLLVGLNEVQKRAVSTVDGPVLILAGAGSGKTRVITHRIAYLIQEKRINPENILAVTFTNKASREMKYRVEDLLGGMGKGLWVTTFHSLGARVLRKHASAVGYDRSFSIYDDSQQKSTMKAVIKLLNLDPKRYAIRYCLDMISGFKAQSLAPDEVRPREFDPKLVEIYAAYQEELKKSQAFDFDDLLFQLVKLFRLNPEILAIYQEQFEYIMVDEYQDTNVIQYQLIRLLSNLHNNVCVVGDEDQSIYSWRGADISNILDFKKDFATPEKGVLRFELSINYRCPPACLEAANLLIKNNLQRTLDKADLMASKQVDEGISYYLAPNAQEEADYVMSRIDQLRFENIDLSTVVILYRTHAQSRIFEQSFMRYGIPYQIFGNVRFFERREIRDVLAYLALLHNPFDADSLFRVINFPPRGIGATSQDKLRVFSHNHSIPPLLAMDGIDTVGPSVQKKFLMFYEYYNDLRDRLQSGTSLLDLTRALLEELEILQYWDQKDEADRVQNLQELLNTIAEYEREEENPTLEGYLEKSVLISGIDALDETQQNVTMMTLHNAKGLEYDHVFIVGMEEGLFPHRNSIEDSQNLEEERRLCYVGITRTMQKLTLSGARLRDVYGQLSYQVPSRFLREIGDPFLAPSDFALGI